MLYLAALFAMALTGAQIEYQALRALEHRGTYVTAGMSGILDYEAIDRRRPGWWCHDGDWNDVGVEVERRSR